MCPLALIQQLELLRLVNQQIQPVMLTAIIIGVQAPMLATVD